MVMEDTLMHLRPTTNFEKLVWERQANKMLLEQLRKQNLKLEELEAKVIQTEEKCHEKIHELITRMKKDNLGKVILKNKSLTEANHHKDYKLAEYKKKNEELIIALARVNKPISLK
jgi:hypothetical protein